MKIWPVHCAGFSFVNRQGEERRYIRSANKKGSAGDKLAAPFFPPYLGPMSDLTPMTLSPSAAKRVAFLADKQGKPAMLRLTVEGGGCSGFQYRYGLADGINDDDIVTETDGVKLVVDEISLELVQGGMVDFVESLGGSAFQVTNPNAAAGCGCGASFSV